MLMIIVINIIIIISQWLGESPVQSQPASSGMERLHPGKTFEQWALWLPFHTGGSIISVEDYRKES